MPFYEMRAPGIPASLKSDMNAVFDKKFGTFGQDYPTQDWPYDVNLMGPLEEKTVSSAPIASFPDGADDVPLKSCVVTFTPSGGGGTPSSPVPIVVTSSLTMKHTGKNLFDKSATDTAKGFIIGKYIDNTGAEVSNANYNVSEYILLNSGVDYTLSGATGNAPSICFYDKDKAFIRGIRYYNQDRSFTTGSAEVYCRISYREDEKDGVMLETGSSVTTYEAYSASTITDSFGQTVYGGERDLLTEKVKRTWFSTTIADLTFVKESSCQHTFRCGNLDRKFGNGNYNLISASFVTYTSGHSSGSNISTLEVGNDFTIFCNSGSKTFYISTDSSYDSKTDSDFTTDFGSIVLVFELATPTELTGLTAHDINSRLGANNFYADVGDTAVTYRSSGTVYQYPNAEEASF